MSDIKYQKCFGVLFAGDGIPFEGFEHFVQSSHGGGVCYVLENSRGNPLRRQLDYFVLACRVYSRRKSFRKLFVWQQYIGYYYAVLSILFGRRGNNDCMAYVIYSPGSSRVIAYLKRFLFRFLINSGVFVKVFFFSKYDELWASTNESIRVYVPFSKSSSSGLPVQSVGSYFFSGGRSNRNYMVLKDICEINPEIEVRVIGSPSQISALISPPINLFLQSNIFGDEFDQCISGSKAVIIPLERPNVLSGQLVILKSFELGKVVFVSESLCIDEWMPPEQTGLFLIRFSSVDNLTSLIINFSDEDYASRGLAARYYYDRYCSTKELESAVLGFLRG